MSNQITDELIMEVIEKGLSAIGEKPKQALWFCLEQDLKVNRQTIPKDLETFQKQLQGFFGLAYNFLNVLFLKYLGEAINEDLSGYSNFVDCIKSLRTQPELVVENKEFPVLKG